MAQARIPSDRPPTPPGEMLLEEFIRPLGMTQAELADRIGVSYVRLNEIVNGRRGITPSTALRLARALGTTPQFWLNLQLALDLYRVSRARTWQYGYLRTRALTAWMDQSSAGMRLSGASQPLITASS
jgi:addiction module HigA family antidote